MRRLVMVVLLLVAATGMMAAQKKAGATLEGTVIDNSGAPVPGAMVFASCDKREPTCAIAKTNEVGFYSLATNAGKRQLRVGAKGYKPWKKKVHINTGVQTLNITILINEKLHPTVH